MIDTFGTIAPTLADNGYDVVPIKPGTKEPRPAEWTRGGFAAQARQFARDYTGILTRDNPAVDIDVSDADLVQQIRMIVLDVTGCHELLPPARVGMPPRMLMLFRTEEPFGKLSTAGYELPSDPIVGGKRKLSKVEILGDGQQFVAFAEHPDTHAPYKWNGSGDPLSVERARLPVLDFDQAAEIVRRADKLLAEHGKRNGQARITQYIGERKSADELRAADPALCRDALLSIPNADEHYDQWLEMLLAAKGALGDDGLDAFLAWSAKSTKHDEQITRHKWNRAQPRRRGAGSIYWMAEQHGWKRPTPVITFGDGEADELLPPDLSDDALALELVDRGGDDYRWSPGLGWMVDVGTLWQRDERLTRYDLARRVCRAAAIGAKADNERKRLASAKTVAAVLTLAQADQRIVVPASVWDADPMLLNTPSGIVDLRTGTLRMRQRGDYVTQAARVAPAEDARAPLFQRFMLDVFGGDVAMVEFMQRALGYCLSGNTREQILMFWHGVGGNGKSTLLDLIHWMLDTYAVKLPAAALMVQRNERHPTDIAGLRGKRLAVSSELDEGQFWNEALIKELTGDEVLTARFMRQDNFQFRVSHKHVIVGNHKPRLRSADHAIARRMVLVPFTQKFDGSRRDKGMLDKLKAEAPAILAWMVRGAVQWYADGLGVPDVVSKASAEYISDHDDVALWMDECCIRSGEAKASELYQSFADWKRQRGEHATSATTWFQRLQAVPGIRGRRSNGIRYEGIRLTDAEAARVRYGDR